MASTAGRRVAVVTGAAQGIGRRTAEVFADEGYALVLNDLREPTQTVGSLESRGAEVLAVVGDVSSEDDVLRLRDRALEREDPIWDEEERIPRRAHSTGDGRADCRIMHAG